MNKLITAGLAALTLAGATAASGLAAAQSHYGNYGGSGSGYGHSQGYGQTYGQGGYQNGYGRNNGGYNRGHRWNRGQYVPRNYRGRERYVDYRRHHLRAPPRGYGWVQGDNNDFLMILLATGLIASVASNGY